MAVGAAPEAITLAVMAAGRVAGAGRMCSTGRDDINKLVGGACNDACAGGPRSLAGTLCCDHALGLVGEVALPKVVVSMTLEDDKGGGLE